MVLRVLRALTPVRASVIVSTLLTSGSSSAAAMRTRWPDCDEGACDTAWEMVDAVPVPPPASAPLPAPLANEEPVAPLPRVPEVWFEVVCVDAVRSAETPDSLFCCAWPWPSEERRWCLLRLPPLPCGAAAGIPDAAWAIADISVPNDSRAGTAGARNGSPVSASSSDSMMTCTDPGSVTEGRGWPEEGRRLPGDGASKVCRPGGAAAKAESDRFSSLLLRTPTLPPALGTALLDGADDDEL